MIVLLKLISGEQVIGRTDGDIYKLERPLVVGLTPTPQGVRLAFTDFILGLNKNTPVKINKETVVAVAREKDINQEIIKEYIRITSGLEIATNVNQIVPPTERTN